MISLRTTALVACLVVLPAVRASAEQLVTGRVSVSGSGVTVSDTVVTGPLAETLRLFVGREVEVTVSSNLVSRIISPERTELRGALDAGAFVESGRRVKLFGPAASLVPASRVCVLDVWSFAASGEACVVAVEGRTAGAWNLVHMFSDWQSPVGVIRSRRPVWVSARRDGRFHIQRGDTTGWIADSAVTLGEAPAAGMIDSIPR